MGGNVVRAAGRGGRVVVGAGGRGGGGGRRIRTRRKVSEVPARQGSSHGGTAL